MAPTTTSRNSNSNAPSKSKSKSASDSPPPAAFSEPSEPSQLRPEDAPAETLHGPQGENPQLVAHVAGRQAGDAHDGAGKDDRRRDGTRRGRGDGADADEEKRADVAGGFGVGRSKL